jgi:hypothetical protein
LSLYDAFCTKQWTHADVYTCNYFQDVPDELPLFLQPQYEATVQENVPVSNFRNIFVHSFNVFSEVRLTAVYFFLECGCGYCDCC